MSYVSTICPVVICPYLCTSESSDPKACSHPGAADLRAGVSKTVADCKAQIALTSAAYVRELTARHREGLRRLGSEGLWFKGFGV